MKRIIVAVLVFAGLAFGQGPFKTDGRFNCRFWNDISEDQRVGMMMGYSDFWGSSEPGMVIPNMLSATKVNFGEMKDGVTAVCRTPENGILTILDALSIFTLRFIGVDEKHVEQEITRFRAWASQSTVTVETQAPPAPKKKN